MDCAQLTSLHLIAPLVVLKPPCIVGVDLEIDLRLVGGGSRVIQQLGALGRTAILYGGVRLRHGGQQNEVLKQRKTRKKVPDGRARRLPKCIRGERRSGAEMI